MTKIDVIEANMQIEKQESLPPERPKPGCTVVYTFKKLKSVILYMYEQNLSLRGVAREFGSPVNHADIQRILRGIEPKDPRKRLRLGLPALAPAPVCPRCGIVHVTKRCTRRARAWSETPIAELPAELLRWKLENREEIA